jgi:hypothetical protein
MNKNELSFSERMAAGKERAANDRYNGKSTGTAAAGHVWKRHYASRDDYRLDQLYRELCRLESWFERWRETEAMCHAAVDIALNGEPYAD